MTKSLESHYEKHVQTILFSKENTPQHFKLHTCMFSHNDDDVKYAA